MASASSYYGYHWDCSPGAYVAPQQQLAKPKKSLAERIGRTFDKIALPGPARELNNSGATTNRKRQQQIHYPSVAPTAYLTQQSNQQTWSNVPYRNVGSGTYGRAAAQSRLAAATSLLYPWEHYEHYSAAGHGDMTYDYPPAPPPVSSNNHNNNNSQFCSCHDYLFGSVRGGYPLASRSGGQCKRCHKVRFQPHQYRQQQQQQQVYYGQQRPPQQPALLPLSYRNPYEYYRQSSRVRGPDEQDWQSYWVEDDEIFRKTSSPSGSGGEKRRSNSGDVGRSGFGEKRAAVAVAAAPEVSPGLRRSILDPGLDAYALNEVNDETDKSKSSSDLCTVTECLEEEQEDLIKSEEVCGEVESVVQQQQQQQPASRVISVLPDPQRSVSPRKLNKKYYKRRTSFQIDEVILEEDEEALAADNLGLIPEVAEGKPKTEDLHRPMGAVASSPSVTDHAGHEAISAVAGVRNSIFEDDDWPDYDKVIVSHNLAEEILDEIYGKLECGKSVAAAEKVETLLVSNPPPSGESEDPSKKKSMADEILDELYGFSGDAKVKEEKTLEKEEGGVGGNNKKRAGSRRRTLRSKDDSVLLDGKFALWSNRFSGNLSSLRLQEDGRRHILAALFRDTTRLRLQQERGSLAALFCHEAPSLGEGRRPRFVTGSNRRPREPPPPPPPVAEVLKPVVPPKHFVRFTQAEVDRINNVINNEDDCFSDFSSDEFDSIASEDIVMKKKATISDDLYDVAEFVESDSKEDSSSSGVSCNSSSSSQNQGEPTTLERQQSLIASFADKTVIRTSESVRPFAATALGSASISSKLLDNSPSSREERHEILISSSSWINVQTDTSMQSQRDRGQEEEEEPVKPPPRLKKLARLQKLQEQEQRLVMLHRAKSEGDMKRLDCGGQLRGVARTMSRPEISPPVLLATTFNPNDAENHKSVRKGSSHLDQQSPSSDRISFKELRRLSSLFPSFSSLNSSLSSITGRSSFYVAEAVYEEAAAGGKEHIYEEIPERRIGGNATQRPLPPIPEQRDQEDLLVAAVNQAKRGVSIFEGASKYEILHYLRNAKDRIGHADFEIELDDEGFDNCSFIGRRNHTHRVSAISNSSDSSSCSVDSAGSSSNVTTSDGGGSLQRLRLIRGGGGGTSGGGTEVERNDSGVGSETSFKHRRAFVRANYRTRSEEEPDDEEEENRCFDCHLWLDRDISSTPDRVSGVVCIKCSKRRSERKEIITELYETELKYGRDLRIIVEEFYRPMLVAGLLNSDQLAGIFLNAEELIQVNACFGGMLGGAIDEAAAQGDEDLCTVNVGRLFLEAIFMLRAYESYCTRQASASLLLTTLEKEKELLKIFLKVSQMENSTLRRMNLSSFLMVPVQRVTKYPLLLARLQKVTPSHHKDKEAIKNAKDKIESALEQMNKDAKDVNSSKLWKRLPIMTSSPSKKSELSEEEEVERTKKFASDALGWKREETRFPLEGRLQFAQPGEANWKRPWTGKLTPINASLAVQSAQNLPEVTSGKELIFPQDTAGIKDASLILFREKNNSKPAMARDPLPLERCIICCEPEWEDFFEIQEFVSKESFVFKGEDAENTKMWFQTLQFYTQSLGGWRKRRKGLGNIMVDPKIVGGGGATALGPEDATGGAEGEGATGGAEKSEG